MELEATALVRPPPALGSKDLTWSAPATLKKSFADIQAEELHAQRVRDAQPPQKTEVATAAELTPAPASAHAAGVVVISPSPSKVSAYKHIFIYIYSCVLVCTSK